MLATIPLGSGDVPPTIYPKRTSYESTGSPCARLRPDAPSISAQANDIAGVKLGMSIAEAKAAFAKPANMKVIPVQTDRVESGLAGWVNPTHDSEFGSQWGGPPDEFFAFKGNAENVWFIQKISVCQRMRGMRSKPFWKLLGKIRQRELYSRRTE